MASLAKRGRDSQYGIRVLNHLTLCVGARAKPGEDGLAFRHPVGGCEVEQTYRRVSLHPQRSAPLRFSIFHVFKFKVFQIVEYKRINSSKCYKHIIVSNLHICAKTK